MSDDKKRLGLRVPPSALRLFDGWCEREASRLGIGSLSRDKAFARMVAQVIKVEGAVTIEAKK